MTSPAQTSFTIPDAITLQPNETYSLMVNGQRRDATVGISLLQEPNRYRYPSADWTVSSAPFRP